MVSSAHLQYFIQRQFQTTLSIIQRLVEATQQQQINMCTVYNFDSNNCSQFARSSQIYVVTLHKHFIQSTKQLYKHLKKYILVQLTLMTYKVLIACAFNSAIKFCVTLNYEA